MIKNVSLTRKCMENYSMHISLIIRLTNNYKKRKKERGTEAQLRGIELFREALDATE